MRPESVLSALSSSVTGLADKEVLGRRREHGPNAVSHKPRITWAGILARQFRNLPLLLLIAASAISFWIGKTLDGAAILSAVLISVFFGFMQEYRAERALEALSALTTHRCLVVRGGKDMLVDSSELVLGDIVIVKEGDRVPSDMRVIECANLVTDEASLTGESRRQPKSPAPVAQGLPLAERTSMVYAGTVVLSGLATCVVTETGARTEFGKIQKTLSAPEAEYTPLQKKLDEFGRQIGIAGIFLSLLFFAGGLLAGEPISRMFVLSVALAVAAIPEGLLTVITLTLAIGMQRMARRNAVVRSLPAVETLGSTTVICTDKTGTLTENKMTITSIWVPDQEILVSGAGYGTSGSFSPVGQGPLAREQLKTLLEAGSLCNNAHLVLAGGLAPQIAGDPTEGSILVAAEKFGIETHRLQAGKKLLSEIAFDSNRKMMTSIRQHGARRVAYSKGAPESILPLCTHVLMRNGAERLSRKGRSSIEHAAKSFSDRALRVMAFAYRELPARGALPKGIEGGMVFAGLVGMEDLPRAEAKPALELCRKAGIRVIMITGDSHATAVAVARQVGLIRGAGSAMSAAELDSISDSKLKSALRSISVFSRASPDHKRRIVEALMSWGEIVAVTGDGINDAPSIKLASIGISMGTTGAEVTKEVSDMVLMDDNFASIVSAIEYGRTLIDNIRSFIRFEFSTTVAALSAMFAAPALGLPLPLNAIQILWINIIMDGPPALALGVEPPSGDEMERQPRNPKEPFITRKLFLFVLVSGVTMAAGTLAILHIATASGNPKAGTLAFTAFVMFQLLNAFNCRSISRSAFSRPFSNKYLFLAVLASFGLQLAIIYLPFFQSIFGTEPLTLLDWAVVLSVALGIVAVEEIRKFLFRKSGSQY